jgi:hypothetical protein
MRGQKLSRIKLHGKHNIGDIARRDRTQRLLLLDSQDEI